MVSVWAKVFSVKTALQAIWSPSSGAVPLAVKVLVGPTVEGSAGCLCLCFWAADAVVLMTANDITTKTKPITVFRKSIVFPPTSYEPKI